MTTYRTGNAIGSADPRDLYDNAENLDSAVNSESAVWTDRFGKLRPTIASAIDPTGLVHEAARSASEAQAARDSAFIAAETYESVSAGLASGDQQFNVVSGEMVVRYENESGEAVKRFEVRSSSYFDRVLKDVSQDEGGIRAIVLDAIGQILVGVRESDGALFADISQMLTNYMAKAGLGLNWSSDENFALAISDANNSILWGITRKGEIYTESQAITGSVPWRQTDERFALAVSDKYGSVVAGIEHDGRIFLHGLSTDTSPAVAGYDYRPPVADRYHITISGQSLSNGQGGTPAISPVDPFGNEMFISGMRQEELMENETNYPESGQLDSIVPLQEATWETPASGIAAQLSLMTGRSGLISSNGVGGSRIQALMRDGVRIRPDRTYYPYKAGIAQARAALELTQSESGLYGVYPLVWIQGESDDSAGLTAEDYCRLLIELKNQWSLDVRAIANQSARIPLVSIQTAAPTNYGESISRAAIGQQLAADQDADIIIATPIYHIATADGVHLTNHGYRWMGSLIGKVLAKITSHDSAAPLDAMWRPLSPRRITQQGRLIQVEFWIPEAPLVLDTDMVTNPGDYGFEVWDEAGRMDLASVTLVDDRIRIQTVNEPVGEVRVRYAYSGIPGNDAGPQTGARGCLRDSDSTVAHFNDADGNPYPLYNFLIHFDKGVDHA